MLNGKTPLNTQLSIQEQAANKDEYTMIRGYPRLKANVTEVEKMYGGKLLPDAEADLMLALDIALDRARLKTGDYPDVLALPNDASNYYMPIPFDVNYMGLTLKSFHKPCWLVIPRRTLVPAAPWKK